MNILRIILGVFAGYLIFVISAIALFKLSGIDAHADAAWSVICLVWAYGIVFSFLGGFTAQAISGTRSLTVNYILAFIMAGFAAFSFFKTSGNHYSQLGAILLFAPASILGGRMKIKRSSK